MENTNGFIASAFPPHNVSPKVKSGKPWGLQGGKAVYYSTTGSSCPMLFYGDRESYSTYLQYAFGDNSADAYKPAVHIDAKNEQHSFLGGIRWTIKNYATKRVQSTVSRIFARQYDPVATALDPTSSDRRESFQAALKTWSRDLQWLQERQAAIGVDLLPQGVDISMLPENDEDLQIFMQDYKLNNEINTELGIKYHLNCLGFESIKEQIDQYLTILPAAGVWCGLDANNMPVVKTLNPQRILAPATELNNYKRIPFAGYCDNYTVAEFKALIGTEYSEAEVQLMVDQFAKKGNFSTYQINPDFPSNYRDVDTLEIVHFEIKTVDEYVYLSRKDKYGNDRFVEKGYDYYRTNPDEFRSKYKTERKINRVQKPTVYGGYWIVGSEIVFGYGEKNYCKGELGYKLRASNLLNGRSSCLLKLMKPSLDMLETYNLKIQQLVASATPTIIKIDLFALRKASYKMNGKDMTTQDLLDQFFQTGVIITDTSDFTGNGDTRKPIEIFPAGIAKDIVSYIDLTRMELETLDETIGYNRVSSGAPVSPEIGKGVAQQQNDATDLNLDHLYRADRDLCLEVYKSLAHLHRLSVISNPGYYTPILGEEAVAIIIASRPYEEIGIDIEARPTQAEWLQFYAEIGEMVKDGWIEPKDRVALRRFKSLKQAEAYLGVVTRKRKKEKLAEQQMLIDKNGEVQQQSNQQTAQNAQALENQRVKNEEYLLQLAARNDARNHIYKMQEIGLQNQGRIQEAVVDGQMGIEQVKARPSPKSS